MAERIHSVYKRVALTVTAGAYSTGQCVGGLQTVSTNMFNVNVGTGEIRGITISDEAKQSLDVDVVFFDTNPASTTFTDNATLDIADADLDKISTVVQVRTHVTFNDNSVSISGDIARLIRATTTTNKIYFTLVARGSATFAAVTDVSVGLYGLSD